MATAQVEKTAASERDRTINMKIKRQQSRVDTSDSVRSFFLGKIEEYSSKLRDRKKDLRRLQAQRNELNTRVRALRDELQVLQESGSYIGEVVKAMGKEKVLVKVFYYFCFSLFRLDQKESLL